MHASVHDLEAESLVCALGRLATRPLSALLDTQFELLVALLAPSAG
jgi:hypothetical protein